MDEKQLLAIIEKAAKLKATSLVLSGKGIKELPAEIGKLTNLTELNLSINHLTLLPAEIGKLTNLRELNLSSNKLSWLPAEIGQLVNLTRLDISYNKLSSLPEEIGQLKKLISLWVNENQLTDVPKELGHLTNLSEMILRGNRLTSVPKELDQLRNLYGLWLNENQLTTIPKELGQLSKLENLYLDDNPLKSPPSKVLNQGTKAILAYLQELGKGKKERYEAKLLILGDGSEGKTCVSRALRGLDFKKQIRTEGVEVVPWIFKNPKFPNKKEKDITLNIWDFEGQEINHQSHQFFLIEKSLYLLVINGRRPFKQERAEYWLDTIRARARKAE